MSRDKFAARMSLLERLGYPVLGLDEAVARWQDGSNPSGTTVITIDDGWLGTYLYMWPQLKAHGFPATLYVYSYYSEYSVPVFNVAVQYIVSRAGQRLFRMSDLRGDGSGSLYRLDDPKECVQAVAAIQRYGLEAVSEEARQEILHQLTGLLEVDPDLVFDNPSLRILSREQIADLDAQGMDIQLHTHNHTITRDGCSVIAEEVCANRQYLSPVVSGDLDHFCYPDGVCGEAVWPDLAKLGIKSATTTRAGLVGGSSMRYALPRILDGENISDLEFEAEMAGFGEVVRRIKGLFSGSVPADRPNESRFIHHG